MRADARRISTEKSPRRFLEKRRSFSRRIRRYTSWSCWRRRCRGWQGRVRLRRNPYNAETKEPGGQERPALLAPGGPAEVLCASGWNGGTFAESNGGSARVAAWKAG